MQQPGKQPKNKEGSCFIFQAYMLMEKISQCQQCSGPSGKYSRGECGGFAWQ